MVGGVAEDTIRNIENVQGGSGNDTLTGDGLANELRGTWRQRHPAGRRRQRRAGRRRRHRRTGRTTVDKTAAVSVTLNGATNAIVTVGGVAEDTIRNIENVQGGSGNDTLIGDGLANKLCGLAATTSCGAAAATTCWTAAPGVGHWPTMATRRRRYR